MTRSRAGVVREANGARPAGRADVEAWRHRGEAARRGGPWHGDGGRRDGHGSMHGSPWALGACSA